PPCARTLCRSASIAGGPQAQRYLRSRSPGALVPDGGSPNALPPLDSVPTILGCLARTPSAIPYAARLYITAAYWFTASTSFAKPAVTIARALSDTYAGIAPAGVAAFVAAQFVGVLLAVALARWLFATTSANPASATCNPRRYPR